jgi:TrmH family RNA methyltransferase
MKRIASRDNASFKNLRALSSDAGARRAAGVALIEGVHLADAFLRSGGTPREVVIGESALDHPEVAGLLARLPTVDALVFDDALFASISQLAQGVAILLTIDRPTPALPERIARSAVVLDRVQDPGNVGSILRSAAVADLHAAYLSRECAGAWSPKVLRAGMGAHFHLAIFEDCDLAHLKSIASIAWIATSPHAKHTIHETDLRGDVAWVFGHEGQGLDAALMGDATLVRIPQPGHGESLNVAAAAAVCFFEQVRQRS